MLPLIAINFLQPLVEQRKTSIRIAHFKRLRLVLV